MENLQYDVVIIGSGPGGHEAALYASQKGLSVAIVEKDEIGGVCVNKGCIPTKFLIHVSNHLHELKTLNKYGVKLALEDIDFGKLMKKAISVAKKMSRTVEAMLKQSKVDIYKGKGDILDKGIVSVKSENGEKILNARNIIIAIGSRPKKMELDINEVNIFTSDNLFELKELPQSLGIIGGGAIGIEYAYIFSSLGTKVYLFEQMEHIIPNATNETAEIVKKYYNKLGIEVIEGKKVELKEIAGNEIEIKWEENNIVVEKVLVSIGREPNTVGIEIIKRDENLKIASNIYAIGDVASKYKLAHVASWEGRFVIDNIIDNRKFKNVFVPWAIFSYPEVAGFGEKSEKYIEVPIKYAGKSSAIEKNEGYAKVFLDKDDNIVGAEYVGYLASEVIQQFLLFVTINKDYKQLKDFIFIHPTMSELNKEVFDRIWL